MTTARYDAMQRVLRITDVANVRNEPFYVADEYDPDPGESPAAFDYRESSGWLVRVSTFPIPCHRTNRWHYSEIWTPKWMLNDDWTENREKASEWADGRLLAGGC